MIRINKNNTTQKRNQTTNEMGGGSGLGLATVCGKVKNYKRIFGEAGEKSGRNANVMYLPAYEKDTTEEKGGIEVFLKGTETVLLVDDEDMITDVGKLVLALLRIQCHGSKKRETSHRHI